MKTAAAAANGAVIDAVRRKAIGLTKVRGSDPARRKLRQLEIADCLDDLRIPPGSP